MTSCPIQCSRQPHAPFQEWVITLWNAYIICYGTMPLTPQPSPSDLQTLVVLHHLLACAALVTLAIIPVHIAAWWHHSKSV